MKHFTDLNPVLLEPTDVLFFRDSVPMATGQGSGHGCRMPWPSTLHEACRATLLLANGGEVARKRPLRMLDSRTKRELGRGLTTPVTPERANRARSAATIAYSSLRTMGPFPWMENKGPLFPIPLDANLTPGGEARPHALVQLNEVILTQNPEDFRAPCYPASTTEPNKHPPSGWWTAPQYTAYLNHGRSGLMPVPQLDLWVPDYHVGTALDPAREAHVDGQLYTGTYLRPRQGIRFAAWWKLMQPKDDEAAHLQSLDFLLLGGEHRLARIHNHGAIQLPVPEAPPVPASAGPCLLQWILLSPAVFTHGWLPGWVVDTSPARRPVGQVCLKLNHGRAFLTGSCLGRPHAFAGWDSVDRVPKPTMLAVPAGSSYSFVCENAATAAELSALLHWRPRSDYYGEKGFGYGVCRHDAAFLPDEPGSAASHFKAFTQQPA